MILANPERGGRLKSLMGRGRWPPSLLLVILIPATYLLCTACKDSGITAARVEREIRKAIPAGATKEQVLQFLSTYQVNKYKFELALYIEDSLYVANRFEEIENGSLKVPQELHEKLKKHLKGFIRTRLPNIRENLYAQANISVTFYFDKDERVIDYIIREEATI